MRVFRILVTTLIVCLLTSFPALAKQGGTWVVGGSVTGSTQPTVTHTGIGSASVSPSNGSIASSLSAAAGAGFNGNSNAQVQTSTGKYRLTLTWQPKNGNAQLDPAPAKVMIYYRVGVHVATSASSQRLNPGGNASASADATATCDGTSVSSSVSSSNGAPNPDVKSDAKNATGDWKSEVLKVTSGFAVKELDLTLQAHAQGSASDPEAEGGDILIPGGGNGSASASASVEYHLPGFDIGRHNGFLGEAIDGVKKWLFSDPTYTRWLPLAFVPQINTEPFRIKPNDDLERPWGNIQCMYSINLRREKHPDTNATGNWYNPPAGNFQSLLNSREAKPGFVITDANGDRLTFDENFAPAPDIRCTVTSTSGLVTLMNAGPPGSIKERGTYTYTFEALPVAQYETDPLYFVPARLLSIRDQHNNTQALEWTALNSSYGVGIFLVVHDSSSGRDLRFKVTSDYLGEVIAPFGSQTAVTTKVTMNSGGYLMRIAVYPGSTTTGTPVKEDTFTYESSGGGNARIASSSQDGLKTTNTYVASPGKDYFALPIWRVATSSYGDFSDSSSSDNGSSIQGTVSYDYGTIREGNGRFGIDSRTNYVTDARGNQTQIIYHYRNPYNPDPMTGEAKDTGAISGLQVTGPTFTGATGPTQVVQWFTPDTTHPISSLTIDPLGYNWTTQFASSTGLPLTTTNPMNQTTTFTWGGPTGTDLISVTDPTSTTWNFEYTPTGGRVTKVKDASNVVQEEATYNSYGQVATISTPASTHASGFLSQQTMTYEATTGDLLKMTGPDGGIGVVGQWSVSGQQIVPGSSYDVLGDPIAFTTFADTTTSTRQLPLTTSYLYNAAQQVTQITLPNGLILTNEYDTGGLPTRSRSIAPIGPLGTVVGEATYEYDTRGRVKRTADLLGTTGQFKYDKNSNLRYVYDGKGQYTQMSYGPNNELTQVQTQGGKTSTLKYNKAGQVRETVDPRGVKANYTHDPAGRLTNITLPDFAGYGLNYTYDAAGRLLTVTKPNGMYTDSVTFAYNHANKWLTSVTTFVQGRTHTVSYTYYPDGRRQTMVSVAAGRTVTTYYYWNINGRLQKIFTPGFGETAYAYDQAGRMLSQSIRTPNNSTLDTEYTWGGSGMAGDSSIALHYLRQVSLKRNNTLLQTWTMTHSHLGELLSLSGVEPNGNQETGTYTYDQRGRILTEARSRKVGTTTYTGSSSYTYDAADNLNAGGNGWSYNVDNQLTSAPAVGGMPGASGISYDATGNMTSITTGGVTKTMTYDPWGQMATVSNGVTTYQYTYDPLGRLASRLDQTAAQTTFFDYDGDALIGIQNDANSAGTYAGGYTAYFWGAIGQLGERSLPAGYIGILDSLIDDYIAVNYGNVCQASGGAYYAHDPWGRLTYLMDMVGVQWQRPYNTDARGNVMGNEGAPNAPPPPIFFPSNGAYRFPGTGFAQSAGNGLAGNHATESDAGVDELDEIGESGSWGQGLARSVKFGWGGVTGMPAWHAGSPERQNMSAMFQGLVPIAGQAYTAYVVATGNDPIAGKCVSKGQRILDGAMLALSAASHLHELATADEAVNAGRAVKQPVCKTECFVAETPIQVSTQTASATNKPPVATRTVKIKDVKIGDLVVSRNSRNGKTELKRVTGVSKTISKELFKVEFANAKSGKVVETIKGTSEHPFFVEGRGFVPLSDLGIGTKIVTRAGPTLVVKSLARESHPEGINVYNFEVEDDHTYFVGQVGGGVWVHNDCVTEEILRQLSPSERQSMGELAETRFRQWLENRGIELDPKGVSQRGGVDAERIGGTNLGWDWAELKPNTRCGRRDGGVQVRQRYRDGAEGNGVLYVYDTNGGGAFTFKIQTLRRPRP